jgi:hypothetical protein
MSGDTEIDILIIDEKIKNSLINEEKKIIEYEERLNELERSLNASLSSKHYDKIVESIGELKEKLYSLYSERDLSFYLIETEEIISRYKKILKIPIKMSFTGKKDVDNIDKKNIIAEYLNIAKKYYCIDSFLTTERRRNIEKHENVCDNCLNKTEFSFDDGCLSCLECGAEKDRMDYSSYKDSDRINVFSKYTYDRRTHFRDCINQYQGKQNCTIEDTVYEELKNEFEKHGLLVDSVDEKVRFSNITKMHILMFLKELGYSKHYENVVLIYYNITGVNPDDISYLDEKLMSDFDLLADLYDKHFKKKLKRVNFISAPVVLYQLLIQHGHPCNKEDFPILKTTERKLFHDSICKEMFEMLGWTYTPLF